VILGMWLANIFSGLALGMLLAPQIGILFGFVEPQSLNDPYWESPHIRAIEISVLAFGVAAGVWMFSGMLKLRLVPCEKGRVSTKRPIEHAL
jgi:hypothetical protein